jgi:hypothetical protein
LSDLLSLRLGPHPERPRVLSFEARANASHLRTRTRRTPVATVSLEAEKTISALMLCRPLPFVHGFENSRS